jgi:hypothetical protein
MKKAHIAVISFLLLAGSVKAEQDTASVLVTNLAQILPFIEQFARNLDLEIPLPLTTNRVSHFYPYKPSVPTQYVPGVWIADNRWSFGFNAKGHFIDTFSDTKHCLGSFTSKRLSPAESKALAVPSAITETQALKMASEYLARLGYDVNRLPVAPPIIRQANPFPAFTIEWPWTATEIPNAAYFKMEIDGLRAKVTSFMALGASAEASLTNSPSAESPKD